MSPWQKLLEQPHPRGHFVQLYDADEEALTENVGHYLWQGLWRGDGVLLIATSEHRELFCRHLDHLGADLSALFRSRQFVCWDAQQTLVQFITDRQPNWASFERVMRTAIRHVLPAKGEGLRAYGEMVGVLWKARQFAAAIRLEQFWNRLLEQASFSLYCAYAIDVFGKDFAPSNLDGVLCSHTHLVPSQPNGALEVALKRAMEETFGPNAEALRSLIQADYRSGWAVMPNAEAMVLWLRRNRPHQAEEILSRAHDHYKMVLHAA